MELRGRGELRTQGQNGTLGVTPNRAWKQKNPGETENQHHELDYKADVGVLDRHLSREEPQSLASKVNIDSSNCVPTLRASASAR